MNKNIIIRPEQHKDYKDIISLILRSFQEGTDYSDGSDIIALVEEIRDSKYYIPELSFVAELDGKIVGHFASVNALRPSSWPSTSSTCSIRWGRRRFSYILLNS